MRRIAFVVVAVLVFAGCGTSSGSSASSSKDSDRADVAAYAKPGPYAVGYTTLMFPDRSVAVWYPADATSVAGKPKATYEQSTPLPDNLKGLVPAQYNTSVTMNAYGDVQASTKGPFPVLLFSHGAGVTD